MNQMSNDLKAKGIDIVNMTLGEPDFNTPEHVKAAACTALEENYTHYTPVAGSLSLREAISAKLQKENGLAYGPGEILVSNGAKQSLCNVVMALIDEGDEVIIPAPYWVSYPQMVLLAGGTPVYVDTGIEQGFKMTPEQLEKAITPRTRMLILCSPSNPTGAVYSKEELKALADVVLRHEDLLVVSDEIYEHLNYVGAHASIASVEGMRERTVIINGVSKAYAMTGWRIGFLAAPKWIVSACSMLQGQYTSGPCSVSQKAAEEAWRGSQVCVEEMRQAFERRRNLLVSLLREIPGLEVNVPDGAFYLFPKCSSFFGKTDGTKVIKTSTDLAMFLLERGHVAVVGGDAFGAPEYFRLSYATSEEKIEEAAKRMAGALALLK
ncbi:MAG: pyridoxal phosphate-dependent aminotransferase [Bacteroidales bacterium]|nr:pyridoxal phosphate-dependent aminotransferase [Bacteroidales bacterium]